MLKYSELIKLSVVYPSKDDQERFIVENNECTRFNKKEYIVTASVSEDILIVNIFECTLKAMRPVYRHFYDKRDQKYVTQKADTGKKGMGTIYTYCSVYDGMYADGANQTILGYFGAKKIQSGLQVLQNEEQKILDMKRRERYGKITEIIDERMAVIPEKPPLEFYDWIRDVEYLNERFFIYTREPKAKEQSGICTFCKKTFSAPAKNGKTTVCPKCGSTLICRSRGNGGSQMYFYRDVSYVECVVDTDEKTAIVERVFHTSLRINDIWSWETSLHTELYISEAERRFYDPDKLTPKNNCSNEHHYYWDTFLMSGECRWCSNNQGNPVWRKIDGVYPNNLEEIASYTTLNLQNVEVSAIAKNTKIDFQSICRAVSKYPVIENLAKQGLECLATEMIELADVAYRYHCCDEVGFTQYADFTQRSAAGFLNVSRPEIKQFAEINITPREYQIYMVSRHSDVSIEIRDIRELLGKYGINDEDLVEMIQQYGCKTRKLISYLRQQNKLAHRGKQLIIDYRDYLRMANAAYRGLNADSRYPKNLIREHDRLTALYEESKNKEQVSLFKKRVKVLEKLDYSDDAYTIFPLRTLMDFINESKELKHCVKTYFKRCAFGQTNIFALRKADNPDKPYFTVNIGNDGKLIQNRGMSNCNPPQEVREFVNKWLKFVRTKLKTMSLKPDENKNRIKIGA